MKDDEWTDCPTCSGQHRVAVQFDVYQGIPIAWDPCPTCRIDAPVGPQTSMGTSDT